MSRQPMKHACYFVSCFVSHKACYFLWVCQKSFMFYNLDVFHPPRHRRSCFWARRTDCFRHHGWRTILWRDQRCLQLSQNRIYQVRTRGLWRNDASILAIRVISILCWCPSLRQLNQHQTKFIDLGCNTEELSGVRYVHRDRIRILRHFFYQKSKNRSHAHLNMLTLKNGNRRGNHWRYRKLLS